MRVWSVHLRKKSIMEADIICEKQNKQITKQLKSSHHISHCLARTTLRQKHQPSGNCKKIKQQVSK